MGALTRRLGEPARNDDGEPLCSFDGLAAHSPLENARKMQRELEAHAERQRLERADAERALRTTRTPSVDERNGEPLDDGSVRTVYINSPKSPWAASASATRRHRPAAEPEAPFISSAGPWVPPGDRAMLKEREAQARSIHPFRFKPGGSGRDSEHARDIALSGYYSSGNNVPREQPESRKRFGSYYTVSNHQFREFDGVNFRWGSYKKNLYLGYKGW